MFANGRASLHMKPVGVSSSLQDGHFRKPMFSNYHSTPNMTGQRFHRTTEVIPCRPWKSRSPFASRPTFPSYGSPVAQSYRSPNHVFQSLAFRVPSRALFPTTHGSGARVLDIVSAGIPGNSSFLCCVFPIGGLFW